MKPVFHAITRMLGLLWLTALPFLLTAQNSRLAFTAHLEGTQEVPPVVGTAQGLVTVTLSADLKTMSIHGVFSGLTGPATAAHFHVGLPGANGPVVLGLTDLFIGGNRLAGSKPLSAILLRQILNGQIYFNVHTAAHPSGEIRGQLYAEADTYFAVKANGQHEVPPVITLAVGVGTVEYTLGGNAVRVYLTATGFSGPITVAHIHQGAEGVNGPVVAPLVVSGNTVTGNILVSTLPANFLQKVDSGQFYINLHTAANPGGEIRGQLRRATAFSGLATLTGDQETPPISTTATGNGWLTMNSTLDSVTYAVLTTGLVPTAAHIHRGAPGVAGPVVLPLTAAVAVPGFFMSTAVAVDSTLLADLLANRLYFNVHTAANPGGEIRGKIESNVRSTYGFDLCGTQEVPANNSRGIGAGLVSLDRTRTSLRYALLVDSLSTPASAAHIHKGAFGVNGPVRIELTVPTPYSTNVVPVGDSIFTFLESDLLYMNVHNANFPGGEIRGQVRNGLFCAPSSAVQDPVVQALEIFPNPLQASLNVRFDSREDFKGQLRLTDMTGRVVWEQAMNISSGEQAWSLPLPTLQQGVYFLILYQQNRLVFYHKLVKM